MPHIELPGGRRSGKPSRGSSRELRAAATTLLKTMIDPNTPASVRVRAAECVMNQATKAIEIEDIEVRVTQLEQAAEASKSGRMG